MQTNVIKKKKKDNNMDELKDKVNSLYIPVVVIAIACFMLTLIVTFQQKAINNNIQTLEHITKGSISQNQIKDISKCD